MRGKHILAATVAPLFLGAISALAAGETQPAPAPAAGVGADPLTLSAAAGGSYMFDADIKDDGGRISRTRTGVALGLDYRFSDTVSMKNRLSYTYDMYNFSDTGSLDSSSTAGGTEGTDAGRPYAAAAVFSGSGDIDPWTNVHTLTYSVLFDYKIDDTWTVFGGPIAGYAAEDGADWGNAFIWGVSLGATYRANPDLVVGLGVAGMQPIEHDFTILPIILFNWKISDEFALRSSGPIAGVTVGSFGGEFVWTFAKGWELAAGVQYEKSRFRLSDSNDVVQGGVGQITGIPVYARLNWKANEQVTVSGVCGMIAAGNLRMENHDGDKLGDADYNAAPFVGAMVSFRQ